MDELDVLATCNGNAEHDMWEDFTNLEYTGELEDYLDDSDVVFAVDNLDD